MRIFTNLFVKGCLILRLSVQYSNGGGGGFMGGINILGFLEQDEIPHDEDKLLEVEMLVISPRTTTKTNKRPSKSRWNRCCLFTEYCISWTG